MTLPTLTSTNPLDGCRPSWIHLAFNMLVQLVVGVPLEMVHGSTRIAVVYMAGVLAGNTLHSVLCSLACTTVWNVHISLSALLNLKITSNLTDNDVFLPKTKKHAWLCYLRIYHKCLINRRLITFLGRGSNTDYWCLTFETLILPPLVHKVSNKIQH